MTSKNSRAPLPAPLSFEAGSVRIWAACRRTRKHEGITFDVFALGKPGEKAGQTRLLRFDCFENTQHYHYGPGEDAEIRAIEAEGGINGAVDWTLAQLATRLAFMVREIGREDVAAALDEAALAEGLSRLEEKARLWLSAPPPAGVAAKSG